MKKYFKYIILLGIVTFYLFVFKGIIFPKNEEKPIKIESKKYLPVYESQYEKKGSFFSQERIFSAITKSLAEQEDFNDKFAELLIGSDDSGFSLLKLNYQDVKQGDLKRPILCGDEIIMKFSDDKNSPKEQIIKLDNENEELYKIALKKFHGSSILFKKNQKIEFTKRKLGAPVNHLILRQKVMAFAKNKRCGDEIEFEISELMTQSQKWGSAEKQKIRLGQNGVANHLKKALHLSVVGEEIFLIPENGKGRIFKIKIIK